MLKSKLIGQWSFYKKTLAIAIPIMVQNLITNFVSLIDNIMVGRIGTEQMSGVAVANQLFFVFNLAIFGAISGASIFGAQFFGKKDDEGVRYTFRYKLISMLAITLIGIGIFFILGDWLIQLYLHDADKGIDLVKTFEAAKEYMLIMLVGLFPFAFEQAYSSTLREGGITTVPMFAGIVAVVVNIMLNWILIFGVGVFPAMGARGAAIATVISRFVQMGVVVAWAHKNKDILRFMHGLYKSIKIPKELVSRITTKGLIPLIANEGLWGASIAMLTQCYSLRGIDVVAGLNISNTVVNLFNVFFIAFGSGIAVVMGQLLGANKQDEAREAAPKLIFFSGAMCVAIGAVMACFSGVFPLIYNTTADVRMLATRFILISAVAMPVHGILHAMYFIIRSGGKTFITFLFDCAYSWCVSVTVIFCLSRFTDLNIIHIYSVCQVLEIFKLIIGYIFIKKEIWISNIVN